MRNFEIRMGSYFRGKIKLMKSLDNIDLKGKRVLVRVDFNVPINKDLEITDNSRIKAHLPTIKEVLDKGGKPILMSHMGRPKGQYDASLSLKPVAQHLQDLLGVKVTLTSDCIGEQIVSLTKKMPADEVLMLENLRFHNNETTGDLEFARQLAQNGDVYINDAFGTAHRAHASTAIIAQFFSTDKAFGRVMEAEIINVQRLLEHGEHPVTAIVGGAKVSSKIAVLENLLDGIDCLIIGGGMAFTFIKAQGGKVGTSLVEDDYLPLAKEILAKAAQKQVKVFLPIDSIVAQEFSDTKNFKVEPSNNISEGWMGLDAGPASQAELKEVLLSSKTILWNGPLGVFEFENFAGGTLSAAKFIVEATAKGAFSLIGGGDSVAAIKKFGLADQVSYVSTGGGAMLEYLEGKKLPGIEAILA